ncbi:IclR family transcriptional regulator [Algicella marina]|uniref:Helix-turn-helix domain-containing protein n=1 Tax=Algicella marina TaxID=2683284 RepID=A0A6P1SYK6_9RHOB|nr:IclR family transcriptional regulator [Algicella marina]QHQ35764.1 helix-turn-helix domain-containing protein [Algicella marina]
MANLPPNLRTIRILELLAQSAGPMTGPQIQAAMNLSKQTVHRLCRTLECEGYIMSAAGARGWVPTQRSVAMGQGMLANGRFHCARHQILKGVSTAVGETVNFVVPEDRGMFYLDRVEADWPFRIQLPVGSHVPFHCTASGKVYLASLPANVRKAFVQGLELKGHTERTHTQTSTLLAELDDILKAGYALDREEFITGMVAIAVPVTDGLGRFLAALATHGPVQRISVARAETQFETMREAAERLRDVMMA